VEDGLRTSIDVGAVIRRTFQIYVEEAPVLMPASAVVFAITGVLTNALLAASRGLAYIALTIDVVAVMLFTGMIVELVADVQGAGRGVRPTQLLRAVRPVLGKLILVGIVVALVVGLLTGIGTTLILALVIGSALAGASAAGVAFGGVIGLCLFLTPGVYLATVWCVAAPVVVLERPDGLRALRRSRELVRGNGWNVFAVIFLMGILIGAVGVGLELGASALGSAAGLVVGVVIGILTAPIGALAVAVLYFNLRGVHGAGAPPDEPELPPFQTGPFPPAAP
jgi:hypothetical protein